MTKTAKQLTHKGIKIERRHGRYIVAGATWDTLKEAKEDAAEIARDRAANSLGGGHTEDYHDEREAAQ